VLDQGATAREVYLPQHRQGWYDFHTSEWFAGGRRVTVTAPLGHIPLFAAGGSMIALSDKLDRLDPVRDETRRLRVFARHGPGISTAELYDDDGLTTGWRDGAGRLLRLELRTDDAGQAILSAASAGDYRPAYDRVTVEPVGGAVRLGGDAGKWLDA
jgi:alpha-glucosidase